MKAPLAILIVFLFASAASGQTVSEIEAKFGNPLQVYSLSEHIWMTPEYASDGQICQMRLFAKRVGPDINYLSGQLPFQEVKLVLNRLLPPSTRGTKDESFGLTETGGGMAWTTYPYEKATFVFAFRLSVSREALKQSSSESYSFSADEVLAYKNRPKTLPSADDFDGSQAANLEIVTIKWNLRKCAPRSHL